MTSAVAPHFRTFGRYEIVRKLGRSMSDVYLARDPIIGRLVVLKIVEQCSNAWSDAIAEAERRGAAIQQQLHAIDHRVLEIYDVGEQNGSFYVAMQYAEGRSVAELIAEKNRLNPGQAAQIAAEICSQLVSLHSFEAEIDGRKRAVVHGDIKPSNIQIGPDGEVCLIDFGIAKAISATRKLTHHDLGSPAYCSPERLNTSLVDPQADLWGVAVTLYEMIAGIPPYQAQTTRKLESVIQSRRPPRALPSECPRPLRGIIQKGLAADPALRYQSAQDFESDLRSFLARKPASAEHELEHRWYANATVERPRIIEYPSRHRMLEPLRVMLSTLHSAQGSLLAGVLTGLFVFVPALQFYRGWTDSEPLRQGRDYFPCRRARYRLRHAVAGSVRERLQVAGRPFAGEDIWQASWGWPCLCRRQPIYWLSYARHHNTGRMGLARRTRLFAACASAFAFGRWCPWPSRTGRSIPPDTHRGTGVRCVSEADRRIFSAAFVA